MLYGFNTTLHTVHAGLFLVPGPVYPSQEGTVKAPRAALPRTLEVIERGMAEGLHIGAQVYVSLDGEPVADFAVGEARRGVPMTPETLMVWLSCSKPIGAVALAQLWEQGRLDVDDPVVRFIPEFGSRGKEGVTLRHLLTHTSGLHCADTGWPDVPWEESIARICDAPLEPGWVPGQRAGYVAESSWFIVGEVVRRLDGRPYARYVREELFEPLEMTDCWIAMSPDQYFSYGDRLGVMHLIPRGHAAPRPIGFDTEAACTHARPGGSGRGPMRELGRFYEMLLARGVIGGTGILTAQSVEALTARHRAGMRDETFRHTVDWGLGFLVDSKPYGPDTVPYGFGRHASRRTFGHGGAESSISFADPDARLVVAWVMNGMPGEARHARRNRALNTAIYEDLALADAGAPTEAAPGNVGPAVLPGAAPP